LLYFTFKDLSPLVPEGILTLNICLLLPILTATVNGLDTSLVNGLQILPAWQEYVRTTNGMILGGFHAFFVSSPSIVEFMRRLGLISSAQGPY